MLGLRIGFRSILHDWGTLTFTALALAAVLGPLLLLLGMKNGILSLLLERMRADVANFEIVIQGDHSISPDEFAQIAQLAHVGYAVPATRSIAAQLEYEAFDGGPRIYAPTQPSGRSDPLAKGGMWIATDDEMALSAPLAARLNAAVGDHVIARNRRGAAGGGREAIVFVFRVVAVLTREVEQRERAYLSPSRLLELESFLDGYAVPDKGLQGKDPTTRPLSYASFRIYADRLENVAALDRAIREKGYDTRSNVLEISNILALDRNLTLLFILVAAVGVVSYFCCLGASLAASLSRRRRQMSLFKLFGASSVDLATFALAHALAIVAAGLGLAFLFYAGMGAVIDALFASSLEAARSLLLLLPRDLTLVGAATCVGTGAVVLSMVLQLSRISPSEVLRDE